MDSVGTVCAIRRVDVATSIGWAFDRRAMLDAGERERWAALIRPESAAAYLVAHAVLRDVLATELEQPAARIEFAREDCVGCGEPHGRPFVLGTDRQFSLSYTEELVVVATASSPVGVDVERLRPDTDRSGVISLMHPSEQAALLGVDPAHREERFVETWVRKEARLKATGIGFALGLDHLPDPVGWRFEPVDVGPLHRAVVARR